MDRYRLAERRSPPPAVAHRPDTMRAVRSLAEIEQEFDRPGIAHSAAAFWVWTGHPTSEVLCDQLDEMVAKGFGRALVYPYNLRLPFLSDEFFELLESVVERAARVGARIWLNPEYNYPHGEGRTFDASGPVSLVLRADPSLRMRELRRRSSSGAPGPDVVILRARVDGAGIIVPSSLERLAVQSGPPTDPDERIIAYEPVPTVGVDGGLVDLLHPRTFDTFAAVVLSRFEERLGASFGTVIEGIYADHEGSYGGRIAWTPDLFDEFARRRGHDLAASLPLLGRADIVQGRTLRVDYIRTMSELYAERFWAPYAAWARDRGLAFTGHVFEESLQLVSAHVGSMYTVQRAIGFPGVDALFDWGMSPRNFKEAQSVSELDRLPFSVENSFGLGADGQRDLSALRRVANAASLWGPTIQFHGQVCSDPDQIMFPPETFTTQPWWDWSAPFLTSLRRQALINASTDLRTSIGILHPEEDVWAASAPLFETDGIPPPRDVPVEGSPTSADAIFTRIIADHRWGNDVDLLERSYSELMDGLVATQLDFVVLPHGLYGELAGRFAVGDRALHVVVVPPIVDLPTSVVERLIRHGRAGGTVIIIDPSGRMGEPGHRQQIHAGIPGARLVPTAASAIQEALAATPDRPTVIDGDRRSLRLVTRAARDGLVQAYLNIGPDPVTIRTSGDAIWDPDSGLMEGAPALHGPWELTLAPDAMRYVITRTERTPLDVGAPGPATAMLGRTRLAASVLPIDGPWSFVLDRPYTRRLVDIAPLGAHGQPPHRESSAWVSTALWPERLAIREWWVAGPYPNDDWAGLGAAYPPEMEGDTIELGAAAVDWRRHEAPTSWVNLDAAVSGYVGVGMFRSPAVAYASTYLHADVDTDAVIRIVGDTTHQIWLDGELVGRHADHRRYQEAREGFAHHHRVRLTPGRHRLLIKVGRWTRAYLGGMGFVLRLCDAEGRSLPGVRPSLDRSAAPAPAGQLCHRIVVPPGVATIRLPGSTTRTRHKGRWRGSVSPLLDVQPGDEVVIVTTEADTPADGIELLPGVTAAALGSWTTMGLLDFVGGAWYETEFDWRRDPAVERWILDCGEVGVAAAATVNGQDVGQRAWPPFAFDVTDVLRDGVNRLGILVVDSEAGSRAVRPEMLIWREVPIAGPRLIPSLEGDGLLGPVRLIGQGPGPAWRPSHGAIA